MEDEIENGFGGCEIQDILDGLEKRGIIRALF